MTDLIDGFIGIPLVSSDRDRGSTKPFGATTLAKRRKITSLRLVRLTTDKLESGNDGIKDIDGNDNVITKDFYLGS
jgi:hypothetical protein